MLGVITVGFGVAFVPLSREVSKKFFYLLSDSYDVYTMPLQRSAYSETIKQ